MLEKFNMIECPDGLACSIKLRLIYNYIIPYSNKLPDFLLLGKSVLPNRYRARTDFTAIRVTQATVRLLYNYLSIFYTALLLLFSVM